MRRELEDKDGLAYLLDRGGPLHGGENTEDGRRALEALTKEFLRIRNRRGERVELKANQAQREFEERRRQRNIVLKARQMGISTWVSARFFLKTITKTGMLTVQVAHTAGLPTIPDAVLSACALIVKNAQATPGMNVKASRMDTMHMQYFSSSLIDGTVQQLLAPWVSTRLG